MGRRPMQPYAKTSRSTHSEAAVSALAPEQGTSEGFPTKCYTFSLFQSTRFTTLYKTTTFAYKSQKYRTLASTVLLRSIVRLDKWVEK